MGCCDPTSFSLIKISKFSLLCHPGKPKAYPGSRRTRVSHCLIAIRRHVNFFYIISHNTITIYYPWIPDIFSYRLSSKKKFQDDRIKGSLFIFVNELVNFYKDDKVGGGVYFYQRIM